MASTAAQPATAGNSTSHPYTCNTCQVAYRNIDLQKGHMKSDWQYVAPSLPSKTSLLTDNTLYAAGTTSSAE